MADEEEERLNHLQTLKAAIHFTIGRNCEEMGAERDQTFSRHVIATLAELTTRQLQIYATDLEAFASHARRTTIIPDDVKLLVRRNPKMSDHIKALIESSEEGKEGKKKRGRKSKSIEGKSSEGKSSEGKSLEGKSLDPDIETID